MKGKGGGIRRSLGMTQGVSITEFEKGKEEDVKEEEGQKRENGGAEHCAVGLAVR